MRLTNIQRLVERGKFPTGSRDLGQGSELKCVVDISKPLGLLLFQQSFAERTMITLFLFGAVCKLYNIGNNLTKFGLCVWTQNSHAMTLLWEVVGPWGGLWLTVHFPVVNKFFPTTTVITGVTSCHALLPWQAVSSRSWARADRYFPFTPGIELLWSEWWQVPLDRRNSALPLLSA